MTLAVMRSAEARRTLCTFALLMSKSISSSVRLRSLFIMAATLAAIVLARHRSCCAALRPPLLSLQGRSHSGPPRIQSAARRSAYMSGWLSQRQRWLRLVSRTQQSRGFARGAVSAPADRGKGAEAKGGGGEKKVKGGVLGGWPLPGRSLALSTQRAQSNVVLRALEPHPVVVEKQSPEQVAADRERAKEYSRRKARADASNVRRRHGRV
jgi:hypothetical protein